MGHVIKHASDDRQMVWEYNVSQIIFIYVVNDKNGV